MIAICLLTCDRYDYTKRTLDTLAANNDLSKFSLYHADDASEDTRTQTLVRSYGFLTIVQNTKRRGWLYTRTKMIRAVSKRNIDWILNLENDIESLRPFPWDLFRFVHKRHDVCSLRLYGRFKDRERKDECMDRYKRTGIDPKWRALKYAPEASQIGWIHWSAQPAVTRVSSLLDLHLYRMDLGAKTVRVKKNVMVHIGAERSETWVKGGACLPS
jgi:GT2 family glycosyltransferase